MATCAVTGTIGDGAVETDVKNTGGTIVLTLTDTTWIAAGGGLAAFSDNFDREDSDSLGANWTEDAGDADIFTNTLRVSTGSFGKVVAIYTGTACSTVDQYVKATWTTGGTEYPNVFFRRTNASSPMYAIELGEGSTVSWFYRATAGGSDVSIDSDTITVDTGSVFGMTITGTGASTVIRVWKNPTGDAPDSAISWGGDTTPDVTLTNPGTNVVDTGNYVGIGGNQNTADSIQLDNFFGGDIP